MADYRTSTYEVCPPAPAPRGAHCFGPSRRLEEDLSLAAYERFVSCTAALDAAQLARAYRSTWEWAGELVAELYGRHDLALPKALLDEMDRHVSF